MGVSCPGGGNASGVSAATIFPRAKSPLNSRSQEGAKMHPSPPLLKSRAGRQRQPGGPCGAPPGARAFPPEFLSGSSDSRGKLNILGQGEAGCQVPTLHGVLPPPPSPPPLPPPTPQPSPPPPAAQIPAQSQRPRRCGCCCCCCRRPRTRPPQPSFEPISAGGESGFSTRNATGQTREPETVQRDRLIPAPRSSRQGRRGGDKGGRQRGRLGKDSGKTPVPREALPLQLLLPPSSSESCREPQPKQAAASGSARRPPPTAPPSHSEEKNT